MISLSYDKRKTYRLSIFSDLRRISTMEETKSMSFETFPLRMTASMVAVMTRTWLGLCCFWLLPWCEVLLL